MTKEEWRKLPKRRGMKVYTAKFNAISRVRPCGMCEWTVESLYKDMATCRRTTGEDNIDRAAFPCEMLYTEEQAAPYMKK